MIATAMKFACFLLFAVSLANGSLCLADKEAERVVLAHYMPWFKTKEAGGEWGYHWTMRHFDPDKVDWDGKREIASHDYPLIGPYDSSDEHVLECQVLLMKLAGLDGVVIDWYGRHSFRDYATNHQRTEKLIPWLKKAGLKFAICYEDQTIRAMIEDKRIESEAAVSHCLSDLEWAEKHWFHDPSYLRYRDRPVVLIFGPRYLEATQIDALRASLASKPVFFGLPHLATKRGLDGRFAWPPVADGKSLKPDEWHRKLADVYDQADATPTIATAFPGFKDVYRQAGERESYGSIDDRQGLTLAESLDQALKSSADFVQIATWNDYGEGTVVEPTRSHGYRNLTTIQSKLSRNRLATAADLRLPVELYNLRKRSGGDRLALHSLDQAADLLFASKYLEAESLLNRVGLRLSNLPARFADQLDEPDPEYRLWSDVLYRDDADAAVKQRCRLDLYYPANKPNFPTVVWFHGGGLTKGERSVPLGLRRQGIAVVTANYRLGPENKSPSYIEDAAAAVAWTFKNIAKYGGATDSIFVAGHSAGGYLGTMVALDKRWLNKHAVDADRIAGLIPLSGQMITHFTVRAEKGIGERQPTIDELAPLFHVRKDAPPMLIIAGDREKELNGRYEENAYFWRMMKVVGHRDVELDEMKGFDHGNMPGPAFPPLLKFIEEHRRSKTP